MQELFIKLINSRSFDKAGNPEAYARRAAINLAFDWRRSRKRNPLRLDQIREPASNESSPLGKLVQAEELDEILNAIGQLNKVPREAVNVSSATGLIWMMIRCPRICASIVLSHSFLPYKRGVKLLKTSMIRRSIPYRPDLLWQSI